MASNLEPGQLQLGNFIFGEGTLFNVESMDIGGYDVTAQDFQVASSDDIRFGRDALKPLPIQLTINARENWLLPNIASLVGETRELHFEFDRKAGDFQSEWRSDSVREKWGEMKPLIICRKDGSVIRVYGRPGKISITKPSLMRDRKIVAEFRRADTFAYSDFEWFVQVPPNEVMNVVRSRRGGMGDAPCWLRFWIVGPMSHPVIELGYTTLELDIELDVNEIAEVSSYPWARRAILLPSGQSVGAKVVSPYLDKLKFDINTITELSWTATNIDVATETVDFSVADLTNFWIDYSGAGAGTVTKSGNVIIWSDSGGLPRLGTVVDKTPSVSPWQRVGFTMASPAEASIGQEECANRIIGRSNATRTEYLYWDITYTRCWFGIHRAGVDTVLSPEYSIPHLCWIIQDLVDDFFNLFQDGLHGGNDWIYDAEFGTGEDPNGTSLWINTHLVTTFSDPTVSLVSDANVYAGFGMQATTRGSGQSTPGSISEFHLIDNYPASVADSYDKSRIFMLWRDAWQVI